MSQKAAPKVVKQQQQTNPLFCDQVDLKNLSFTELDPKNERSKAQMISFGRYKYPNGKDTSLVIQSDPIKLTQYGIPKANEDYYKTDDERGFIKIPFDPSQESCKQLEKFFTGLDNYMETEKDTVLGKFARLYTYSKSVKEPSSGDELEQVSGANGEAAKKAERFKYCKIKFDMSYPDKNILTSIFVKNPDGTCKRVAVNSVAEVNEYINWGSTIRFIAVLNKLWAAKNKDDSGIRKFGVSFKFLQIEVTPNEKGGASIRDDFTRYAFADRNGSTVTVEDGEATDTNGETQNPEEENEAEPEADQEPEADPEADPEAEPEAEPEENEQEPEPEPEPEPKPVKKVVVKEAAAPPVKAGVGKSVKSVKSVKSGK